MRVSGKDYRTIWMEGPFVYMIDQNRLPFHFEIFCSDNYHTTCEAIRNMTVRGAGAIGAAAGFAMAQACLSAPPGSYPEYIEKARSTVLDTRPTARDLFYFADEVFKSGLNGPRQALIRAQELAEENAIMGRRIGEAGLGLVQDGCRIGTHCNAGWLGLVDFGSALAPVYLAHRTGKKVFVYVDETRPRNQGSRLTAWELLQEGVPFTIICDHTGAWLMARKKIDLIIVGADRIAMNGDVANKIGTLEKAVVAAEFGVPFYVAAPTSTFDPDCATGSEICIEEREGMEITHSTGLNHENNSVIAIETAAPGSTAYNPAFDVTPARYITGFITDKGIIRPDVHAIRALLN